MTNATASVTWNTLDEVISSAKKNMGKEMFSSYQSLITHQNALVSWLGYQVDNLAEEMETKEARMTAKAVHSLWGDLYQMEDSEEEKTRRDELVDFFVAFKNESESPWLTLTYTVSMVRFALDGGIYFASKAAEDGNTGALETLANFKSNKASFEDIADSIIDIAGLND